MGGTHTAPQRARGVRANTYREPERDLERRDRLGGERERDREGESPPSLALNWRRSCCSSSSCCCLCHQNKSENTESILFMTKTTGVVTKVACKGCNDAELARIGYGRIDRARAIAVHFCLLRRNLFGWSHYPRINTCQDSLLLWAA